MHINCTGNLQDIRKVIGKERDKEMGCKLVWRQMTQTSVCTQKHKQPISRVWAHPEQMLHFGLRTARSLAQLQMPERWKERTKKRKKGCESLHFCLHNRLPCSAACIAGQQQEVRERVPVSSGLLGHYESRICVCPRVSLSLTTCPGDIPAVEFHEFVCINCRQISKITVNYQALKNNVTLIDYRQKMV